MDYAPEGVPSPVHECHRHSHRSARLLARDVTRTADLDSCSKDFSRDWRDWNIGMYVHSITTLTLSTTTIRYNSGGVASNTNCDVKGKPHVKKEQNILTANGSRIQFGSSVIQFPSYILGNFHLLSIRLDKLSAFHSHQKSDYGQ